MIIYDPNLRLFSSIDDRYFAYTKGEFIADQMKKEYNEVPKFYEDGTRRIQVGKYNVSPSEFKRIKAGINLSEMDKDIQQGIQHMHELAKNNRSKPKSALTGLEKIKARLARKQARRQQLEANRQKNLDKINQRNGGDLKKQVTNLANSNEELKSQLDDLKESHAISNKLLEDRQKKLQDKADSLHKSRNNWRKGALMGAGGVAGAGIGAGIGRWITKGKSKSAQRKGMIIGGLLGAGAGVGGGYLANKYAFKNK